MIGTRSASGFPRLAASQVVAAQQGIAAAGMIGTLKHFPGHGSVTADSHRSLPVLRKSLAALRVPTWCRSAAASTAGPRR